MFLVLLMIYVFAQCLTFEFLSWDDKSIILENPQVKSLSWVGAWTDWRIGSFFPLTILNFALDHRWFGFVPAYFHGVNVVLHMLNVLVLLVFLRSAFLLSEVALLFIAGLFALHPAQTEVVAWASARRDLLSTLALLLALQSYLLFVKSSQRRFYIFALTLALLAMGFKVIAVVTPALMLLLAWQQGVRVNGSRLLQVVPLAIVGAIFGWVEVLAEHSIEQLHAQSGANPVWLLLRSYVFYTSKYLYPFPNVVIYDSTFYAMSIGEILCGVALMISFAFAGFVLKANRDLVFGALFAFVLLLPISKIVPYTSSDFNMRYLYLASAGFSICAAIFFGELIKKLPAFPKRLNAERIVALVLILAAIVSYRQVSVWKNDLSLWSHMVELFPQSARAQVNLGNALLAMGQVEEARPHIDLAYSLQPQLKRVLENKAYLLLLDQKPAEAIELYKKAYIPGKNDASMLTNMAKAFLLLGEKENADRAFKEAQQLKF